MSVCEMLGIEQPIVQAPIAAVPQLAAAVSDAGALGMVTLTWSEDAGAVVRETAALTARPFGGNFILTDDHHRRLEAALEAGLQIVSFMWGDPSSYVKPVHDAGGIVLHTVGSAEEARRAVGSGVDVIVAQGWEAGGHVWGTVATLPLVPAVVDAVAPVPVIAAGGIGDARGVAAVLALGAQAAWLGTRFLLAEEMPIHEDYRGALIAAAETDAQWYANLYDLGWPDAPHRALRNSTGQAWEAAGCPPDGKRPGEGEVIAHFASGGSIVRYASAAPMAGTTGQIEALSMWAGQGVALARKSQSAADIVTELTSGLPGRAAPAVAAYGSVAGLAGALRRAEAAHAKHEQETGRPDPDWPDWYARHMADESAAGQAAGSRAPMTSSP
ncbi:MAG TPA: nitronate monooxygenase [Streptosporangiaceae bacterium]|nr:nitronate monooxygenase [Streptosporangiaceae bacterium]